MPLVIAMFGVLFVGLKLGGVITWSWVWVLSPFWGGVIIATFRGILKEFIKESRKVLKAKRKR